MPFAPAKGDDAGKLFWALTLDHHAAALSTTSPYDTIQLSATPRDQNGKALQGLNAVTFRSSDVARVTVTAEGLVRALQPGSGILVIAELSVDNIRRADTLLVNITDDVAPRSLASISLRPQPPDSTTWAVTGDGSFFSILSDGTASGYGFKFMQLTVVDTAGNPMPEVAVDVRSSDVQVAQVISAGSVVIMAPVKPGHVNIIASSTAYGVTRADTVPFTMTYPVYAVVKIVNQSAALSGITVTTFTASSITIRPGGTVVWVNDTGLPVDIAFDDPTSVVEHGSVSCAAAGVADPGGEGDVEAFGVPRDPQAPMNPENCRSRRFSAAGIYSYHSVRTGATGRVVVTDDQSSQ